MSVNCSWLGGCLKEFCVAGQLGATEMYCLVARVFLLAKDGTKTCAQSGKTCLVPKLFRSVL